MSSKFQTPEKYLKEGRTAVLRLNRAVVREELVKRLTKAKKLLHDAAINEEKLLDSYRLRIVDLARRHLRTTFKDARSMRRVLYQEEDKESGYLCRLKFPSPPTLPKKSRRAKVLRLEARIRHLDATDPKKEIRMSPPVYAHYLGDDER